MEYLFDLRFEDPAYNAVIHFATTLVVRDETEANLFFNELIAGFRRKGIMLFTYSFYRIDHDDFTRQRTYEYLTFCRSIATAQVQVEQFVLENPDQTKSLADNMIDKFFKGENSTANIGKKLNVPVKVFDKQTKNPIANEFFYFSIEHLIPR